MRSFIRTSALLIAAGLVPTAFVSPLNAVVAGVCVLIVLVCSL